LRRPPPLPLFPYTTLFRSQGWKYGLESPFKADVYYVVTRLFTGNKWGTANPVMMRDQDFGVVRLRAFGIYDFKIVEPKLFLKERSEEHTSELQSQSNLVCR